MLRPPETTCIEFVFTDTEFADDTGVVFTSREELMHWTPKLYQCFADFGLEVHARGPNGKKDKTEILFCAAPPRSYADCPNAAALRVGDKDTDQEQRQEVRHMNGCFNYDK